MAFQALVLGTDRALKPATFSRSVSRLPSQPAPKAVVAALLCDGLLLAHGFGFHVLQSSVRPPRLTLPPFAVTSEAIRKRLLPPPSILLFLYRGRNNSGSNTPFTQFLGH